MINEELKRLMNINPSSLAEAQAKALKEHIIDTLARVSRHIELGAYGVVLEDLVESPTGDGHGTDNFYINFGYTMEPIDLYEALEKLQELEAM
jgi:hypothetical protein